MDFLKILKSFEEFVYEVLTWLVLLPRTMWRILVSPQRMTTYAAEQLASTSESRYSEAISPPLLLILCVLIAHVLDLVMRHPAPMADDSLATTVLSSEQNLLLYRTIAFGIWAMVGAIYLLLRTGSPVNRETLRQPFYEQCYLVSPFALAMSIAATLTALDRPWSLVTSLVLMLSVLPWFWLAQAAWLRQASGLSRWRSLVAATIVIAIGSLVNMGIGILLTTPSRVTTPAKEPAAEPSQSVPDRSQL